MKLQMLQLNYNELLSQTVWLFTSLKIYDPFLFSTPLFRLRVTEFLRGSTVIGTAGHDIVKGNRTRSIGNPVKIFTYNIEYKALGQLYLLSVYQFQGGPTLCDRSNPVTLKGQIVKMGVRAPLME